jgi:hypothetical protein
VRRAIAALPRPDTSDSADRGRVIPAGVLWVLLMVLVVRNIWIENREADQSCGGCEARWFKARDSRASLGHNTIQGSKYRKSG